MAESAELTKLVQRAVDQLGEHCDSVQIFVTRHNPDGEMGTHSCVMGTGNWYARFGQVKEWVVEQEEGARQHVRKNDDQ